MGCKSHCPTLELTLTSTNYCTYICKVWVGGGICCQRILNFFAKISTWPIYILNACIDLHVHELIIMKLLCHHYIYTPCTDILLKNHLRAIHAFVFIGGLRPMMKMSLWELILIHNLTNLTISCMFSWSESVRHHGWWQQWRQMDCTWLHKWNLPCNCALYIGLCELVPLHIQWCESLPESG